MPKIRGIRPETWTDETFVELSPLARLLYIGMWNFACDNGHLEDRSKQIKMRILPADNCNAAELLRELEDAGRIHREDGWITVPKLAYYQKIDSRWFATCARPGCAKPPKAPKESNPERETRVRRGGGAAVPRPDVDVDGELMLIVKKDSLVAGATRKLPHPDAEALCNRLADAVAANGSKRPTVTEAWRKSARLLLDRDKRPLDEAMALVDWCQADSFWRSNVLSMPKFREKYDQLRLKSQQTAPTSRVQGHMALAAQLAGGSVTAIGGQS